VLISDLFLYDPNKLTLKTNDMKTINLTRAIIIVLLAGFISSFSSYAASPAAAASARNIRQKFIEAVQNPDDLIKAPTSGEVEILFTVNDDGTLNIKKMDATNDDAADYVTKKITNLNYGDSGHPFNQYYSVKFHFQED
jgi:hypothetical protein